jgi:hypothetical protein
MYFVLPVVTPQGKCEGYELPGRDFQENIVLESWLELGMGVA